MERHRAGVRRPAGGTGRLRRARRAGRLPARHGSPRPAIDLARDGFPWADVSHRLTVASRRAARAAGTRTARVYLPDGEPIAAGRVVRLPGLADALGEFVDRGDGLLAGPVGDAIVADGATPAAACSTADDLALARAEWAPCADGAVAGRHAVGDAGADPRPVAARRRRRRHARATTSVAAVPRA